MVATVVVILAVVMVVVIVAIVVVVVVWLLLLVSACIAHFQTCGLCFELYLQCGLFLFPFYTAIVTMCRVTPN